MELILIMQHIELSTWTFSTEVLFFASAMALCSMILTSVTSASFLSLFKCKETKLECLYLNMSVKQKFIVYSFVFMAFFSAFYFSGKACYLSLFFLAISASLNLVFNENIKSAIVASCAIVSSFIVIRLGMVDYFDFHNSLIFGLFAFVSVLPFLMKSKISAYRRVELLAGLIISLSFTGYSYNTNRVLTQPSINDFHHSIKHDLRSGIDAGTLSKVYDAKIVKTQDNVSEITTTGLKDKFTGQPIQRISTTQVINANGINYKISSENHATVIYSQAKTSTIIMMLMPSLLWIFVIGFLGSRYHTKIRKENK